MIELTPAQRKALEILTRDGAAIAGVGSHNGRVEKIAAATLKALAARGLGELRISPDGGMMLCPIEAQP